jgi:hypothetical protein
VGQLTLENQTPFVAESLFLADEEGTPLLVAVVKASYALSDKGLTLAEEQAPVNPAGEPWGRPGESSIRYEPSRSWPRTWC